MLDRILTASRTVERPTPKICINSGSGGSFSPTSNFPDMNCSCNRPASSSASDFLLSCLSMCIRDRLTASVTALGTQSSAATIPVTLAQTLRLGVRPQLASFVVPLCATIHLSGSMMKIVACALAVSMLAGLDIPAGTFAGFILLLGVTMIAAPGVPGGAIMAALGLLESMLGFDETLAGLMIATYIAMDSFGTATNVTGDGAVAVIVDAIDRRSKK